MGRAHSVLSVVHLFFCIGALACLAAWCRGTRAVEQSGHCQGTGRWIGWVGWWVGKLCKYWGCLRCQWPAITLIVASSVFSLGPSLEHS